MLRHVGRHHLGVEAGQPRPQGLGEGLVGHRQVFLAATEQHQRAFVVGAASQRRHQAGLAHSRLTGDEHGATLARARRLERGAQHGRAPRPGRRPAPLASPPAPPATDRPLVARRRTRIAARRHRLGDALQDQLADRLVAMAAAVAGEHPHHVGGQDLMLAGGAAQPAGGHDRRPEHVAVLLGHVTDGHPDPEPEARHLALAEAGNRLLDRDRGRHRVGGAAEGRQAAVAHRLDQHAVARTDGGGERGEQRPPRVVGPVDAEPAEQLGGADDIGHQHRHRAAARHTPTLRRQ